MKIFLSVSILFFNAPLYAAINYDNNEIDHFNSLTTSASGQQLFADMDKDKQENQPQDTGTLILPAGDDNERDKKCMKVCEKWGEDCIINPKTGNRKCRRICKLFGEECF